HRWQVGWGGAAGRRLLSRESHIPERAQETRSALAGASPWSEPSPAKPPRHCLLLAEPAPGAVLAEFPEALMCAPLVPRRSSRPLHLAPLHPPRSESRGA